MTFRSPLGRAALFGAITGLRSMLGVALLSRHLAKSPGSVQLAMPESILAAPHAADVLTVMSAGEVVADKLPWVPARTSPGPLAFRILLGALAGAAACSERRESRVNGAAIGAGAALAAAYGAYYLRRWLTKDAGLPDGIVAAAEDSLAYSVGQHAVRM